VTTHLHLGPLERLDGDQTAGGVGAVPPGRRGLNRGIGDAGGEVVDDVFVARRDGRGAPATVTTLHIRDGHVLRMGAMQRGEANRSRSLLRGRCGVGGSDGGWQANGEASKRRELISLSEGMASDGRGSNRRAGGGAEEVPRIARHPASRVCDAPPRPEPGLRSSAASRHSLGLDVERSSHLLG
jgi:hypothetical protein